jgi:DNA helicase-2/ATP-dependent DNA helicase PcrA
LLTAYTGLTENPVFKRRELWSEMRRALHRHKGMTGKTLRETAWSLRETARRIGRTVPHHCISTTLLVKGLQFDHAVILNLKDFQDAENAYVAMTRGAHTLTILSDSPKVRFEKPHYSRQDISADSTER